MSIDVTVEDLTPTIVAKVDQLTADALLGGSRDIVVTGVRIGTVDQPISIDFEGDKGQPFRPCKTMRRVLLLAWGPDGNEWIGKAMRLYRDDRVRFGGDEVGGVRISHLSHIDRRIQVSLSATKGKKAVHTIDVMKAPEPVGLPTWPQDAFDKKLPGWRKAVAERLKTPQQITEWAEERGALTEAQLKTITDLKPAEPSTDA